MKRLATLLALLVAGPASAQQRVPLVLNHLAIVLDSATYHDVRNSPFFMQQFSAVDTALRQMFPGMGVALLGKYNYLVIGGAGAAPAADIGRLAIVLGSEQPGGPAALGRIWGLSTAVQVGNSDHSDSPLYAGSMARILSAGLPDSASHHVQFRVQQYSESAARQAAQVDSLPVTDLSVSRFLAPYHDPKKFFSYLTGATLAIPVVDIVRISALLQRDGVTVIPEGEGAIIKLDGFTLHLIPSFVGAGVKELQFALTRTALGNPIYQFGPKSQLRFGPGPIAVWSFKWP